jgi:hypothetical protein
MKLSPLTPTDKIKLAAELDGWWINAALSIWQHKEKEGCPPNYHDSYDAIIPLIQKQPNGIKLTLIQMINWAMTPSQLLDALLVSAGKAEQIEAEREQLMLWQSSLVT